MNYLSSWPFMNNPCSWTKWEFMNRISSCTHELSWKSHLLFKNIHEPFMNTLINVHERSYFFVHEHSWNIHECSWTVHDHLTGAGLILSHSGHTRVTLGCDMWNPCIIRRKWKQIVVCKVIMGNFYQLTTVICNNISLVSQYQAYFLI